MLRFSALFIAALTAVASGGCDDWFEEPGCTLIGCTNGASLTVARVAAWADGQYTLDVQVDALQHSCLFTLPLPPGARPNEISLREQQLDCTPPLPVQNPFGSAAVYRVNAPTPRECPTGTDAGAGQSCSSDRYRLSIGIEGAPAEIGLRLSVADTVLLDERRTLEYQTSYPNGPDCGGPCRTASLTFNVEEP
jgi:hypothetical protein